MTEMEALGEAIRSSSEQARLRRRSADPTSDRLAGLATLTFIHRHLRSVQRARRFRMPGERGRRGRQAGADLAALVDRCFVAPAPERGYPQLIAASPPEVVVARSSELVRAIGESYLISLRGEPTKAYLVGLCTWLGCVGMAELLRPIYASPDNPKLDRARAERERKYVWLKRRWQLEEKQGNPWVRLGVESARIFKEARNEPVQDSWVPNDSPYWRGLTAAPRLASSAALHRFATPAS